MKRHGFTIIELVISMVLLLMAMAGISLVYITTEGLHVAGSRSGAAELTGIQRKSQSPEEYISRIIRLAKWAEVDDFGDNILVDIPQDSSGLNIVQSSFYFSEYNDQDEESLGSIFYDPDTSLDDDEVELYTNIYKIYEDGGFQPVFSIDEDLPRIIKTNFGYFKGDSFTDENRRKVEFKVKMRNV